MSAMGTFRESTKYKHKLKSINLYQNHFNSNLTKRINALCAKSKNLIMNYE